MTKTQDLYQKVTDKIITLMESHQLDWDKPWITLGGDGRLAHNVTSDKTYRGVNQFLLGMTAMEKGYVRNGWLTFNQCKSLGGKVKKGSKASEIYFYKFLYIDGNKKKYAEEAIKGMTPTQYKALGIKKLPMLKFYYVFNLDQTEELPPEYYELELVEELQEFDRDESAEQLIKATDAKITIKESNRAYYAPVNDIITVPLREQFKGKEPFYATTLHELSHWTGAKHRLDRPLINQFGDSEYAREELIAELSSAFLCAELGFSKTISQSAAYLQSWLGILKKDPKFIMSASYQAQKSADYILAFQGATT